MDYTKKIIKHKPWENANGQYNYGRLESEGRHILGIPESNFESQALELYTIVEHAPVDWSQYPEGIPWNYYDSRLIWESIIIQGTDAETDKDRYYNTQVLMYLYDTDRTGILPTSGNELRTLLGNGDDMTLNNPHAIAEHDYGTYYFPHSCDPNGWGGDECAREIYGDSGFKEDNMQIYDFPVEGHSKTNSHFSTAEVFNTDITNWGKAITGKIDNSNFHIIVRCSGDESEYSPLGHGWGGLSGGYKPDERDRSYTVFTIPKKEFYEPFIQGQEKVFCSGGPSWPISDSSWDDTCDYEMDRNTYSDNYGNHDGHGWPHSNGKGKAYYSDGMRLRCKPPEWSPQKALLQNYKWTKKTEFGKLHPKYNLDYTGFPPNFYNDENKFWDSSLIKDFRPISSVESIVPTDGEMTDLQNYYPKGSPWSVNSSAPMTIKLKFDLAKNIDSFTPKYYDEGEEIENNTDGIHYGWFVANWEWDSLWEGGETLDEIANNDFPETEAEHIGRAWAQNTYKLKVQGDESEDDYGELRNEAVHTYNSAGVKVIKVIFLTYIESHHSGQDLKGEDYAGNYIQALDWKMATVKINLTADRAFANDFSDIGGADYTYLPYPDVIKYDFPLDVQFDDETGQQYWCEDDDNPPPGTIPLPGLNCEKVTSAHPVISGLSLESVYVQALNAMLAQDVWGEAEGGDRSLAEKSFENTPLQSVDEFGDYLGQADISTTRFFNRPYDMRDHLGNIHMVYGDVKTTPIYAAEHLVKWNCWGMLYAREWIWPLMNQACGANVCPSYEEMEAMDWSAEQMTMPETCWLSTNLNKYDWYVEQHGEETAKSIYTTLLGYSHNQGGDLQQSDNPAGDLRMQRFGPNIIPDYTFEEFISYWTTNYGLSDGGFSVPLPTIDNMSPDDGGDPNPNVYGYTYGYTQDFATNHNQGISSLAATKNKIICRNGEEVELTGWIRGLGDEYYYAINPQNGHMYMTPDSDNPDITGPAGWYLMTSGQASQGPNWSDFNFSAGGVSGEYVCWQLEQDEPFASWGYSHPNFLYGSEYLPVEEGIDFFSYNNVNYWNGISNKFPEQNAATSIFIDDYPLLADKCLTEMNFETLESVTIRDSSGNGSKGIVFGDYSIKKDGKDVATVRDSNLDTPKIGTTIEDKAY